MKWRKLRPGVIGARLVGGLPLTRRTLPSAATRLSSRAAAAAGPELAQKTKDDWGFAVASEDYRDVIDAGMDICLVASSARTSTTSTRRRRPMRAPTSSARSCSPSSRSTRGSRWSSSAERADYLLVSFGWNYLPPMREAKRLMDEYGIGSVEQSSLQMASVCRELLANLGDYPAASPESVPEQATWTDPANGGGYAQAQLSHALGVSLWLTGLRGAEAFALMTSVLGAPVEHHDAVVIRYQGGSIGTMSGGSCHLGAGGNRHQLEFRAIGSEGQLMIDLERDELWLYRVGWKEAVTGAGADAFALRL